MSADWLSGRAAGSRDRYDGGLLQPPARIAGGAEDPSTSTGADDSLLPPPSASTAEAGLTRAPAV